MGGHFSSSHETPTESIQTNDDHSYSAYYHASCNNWSVLSGIFLLTDAISAQLNNNRLLCYVCMYVLKVCLQIRFFF